MQHHDYVRFVGVPPDTFPIQLVNLSIMRVLRKKHLVNKEAIVQDIFLGESIGASESYCGGR